MHRNEFEQSVAEWLSGEMSLERRTEFEGWLKRNPEFEAEALSLSQVWGKLSLEEKPPEMRQRWQPHLEAALARPGKDSPQRQHWFALAATLAVGVAIGWLMPRADSEIGPLRHEIQGLQIAMASNLVRMESASDRLAGVALAAQLASAQPEFRQKLLGLIKDDSNLNVRLAAMDALVQAGYAGELDPNTLNLKSDDPFAQWLPANVQSGAVQEL